jgi:hypothetical protein
MSGRFEDVGGIVGKCKTGAVTITYSHTVHEIFFLFFLRS